jgi:hypothetical protein
MPRRKFGPSARRSKIFASGRRASMQPIAPCPPIRLTPKGDTLPLAVWKLSHMVSPSKSERSNHVAWRLLHD